MKRKIFRIFEIAAVLIFAVSCSDIADEPSLKSSKETVSEKENEKAELVFEIVKNNARTIMPKPDNIESLYFTLKGKQDGESETTIFNKVSYSA